MKSFWVGKKVLITGHTGFKGSWLSLWLSMLGADVIGYSLAPPTTPSLFDEIDLVSELHHFQGDIRNLYDLNKALAAHKPEIVFHMAAQSIVQISYLDPVETFSTNVLGTVNVLEAVRQSSSVRVAVIVSSDKCYQNREWNWAYREDDSLGGRDPYSSSKACVELVVSAYRDSYFPVDSYENHSVAIASVRAGNVIGGGDWATNRLIPDIVRAMMDDRPVSIRSPNAVRPWQFVLEPLRGYLDLAYSCWSEGSEYAQAWNFGPFESEFRTVSWIVNRFTGIWGNGATWHVESDKLLPETLQLKVDSSRARDILGWSPKLSISQSLDWTVEWYRGFQDHCNVRALTERQVSHYESL